MVLAPYDRFGYIPCNDIRGLQMYRLDRCLLVFVFLALSAIGADGPRFDGYYSASNLTESGDDVYLTFSARVFNHGDSTVGSSSLFLENRHRNGDTYHVFMVGEILAKTSVYVEAEIVMPQGEYLAWEKGARPHLRIKFQNSQGVTEEIFVRLIPSEPALLEES